MHFARLENSPRLKRVLEVLKENGAHTTYEIQERARVCAVASSVSELRAQGFSITCKKRKGAFEYRLIILEDDDRGRPCAGEGDNGAGRGLIP